jgi:ribonuclease HI
MGLSVVVRDSDGKLLAARCDFRVGWLAPAVAEAQAVLLAIQLCREMGIQKIHFEGDAKSVVDAVNDVGADMSSLGLVIEDIRRELNSLAMWKMTKNVNVINLMVYFCKN